MTLEQLEFIVAVHREGTLYAAAQKLNISHSSISRAISSLEDELGVNLFIRTRSGTSATPEGSRVIEGAQRILAQVAALREIGGHRAAQSISISVFPADSMFFLSGLIRAFSQACDYATIHLAQSSISESISKLKDQQTDLGILAIPQSQAAALPSELKHTLLFESQLSIACSPASPLAHRPYVTPMDVQAYPFVLHPDPMIVESLQAIFRHGSFPNVLTYTNDNSLIKQMAADDGALCVYTSFLANGDPKVAADELRLIPLQGGPEDDPGLFRILYLALYSKKKQLTQAERLFLRMLRECTSQWRQGAG